MKHLAAFILLAVLAVAWAMPVEAQGKGVAGYGHQSQKAAQNAAEKEQKAYEKAARTQQKRLEKYHKKQQKAAKNAARNATKNGGYPSRTVSR
jgi:uncharacterized protein HemX